MVQRCRGQVDLTAEDGFDSGGHRVLVKLHRSVEVAMVRDRHRRHAKFRGTGNQCLGPHRGIQCGILGVNMEMDKG